ncbi:MAG: tetratricopeptide repeat protein [Candidatus Omnitrophica bacterium]|nr:tetratricopeptide repeat protein [Candidatus Omnitrophota bacterium]
MRELDKINRPGFCLGKQIGRVCFAWMIFGQVILSDAWAFPVETQQAQSNEAQALAHYVLGQVYDFLGLSNRAVLEFQQSAQLDPTVYFTNLRLGAAYARLGMLDDAKQALRQAAESRPADTQAHYLMALIYSTQKNYDQAAAEYELILRSLDANDPRGFEIHNYLAQLYYSQKKYPQAIAQFEKMLSLEPQNTDVMYFLGALYFDSGKAEKAEKILLAAIVIDPEHDGCLNTLAYIYAEQSRKLDQALALVNRALKIAPDQGAYWDTLGWIYFRQGKTAQALEMLNKAGSLLADPVIFDHLGDVYAADHNLQKALAYWKMALELDPEQKSVAQKIKEISRPHS